MSTTAANCLNANLDTVRQSPIFFLKLESNQAVMVPFQCGFSLLHPVLLKTHSPVSVMH